MAKQIGRICAGGFRHRGAALGFHTAMQSSQSDELSLRFLLEAVLLLSVLMFYMGGE